MMFENLTESAIESIEGASPGPSNPVKVVLKHISEGRKLHYDQVSSDHLISTIRYLLDAFGWVKRRVSEDGSPELVQDRDSSGEEVGGKTNPAGKRITPTLSPKQLQESVYKKLKQSGGTKASRSGAHLAHLPKVIVEEESTLKPPVNPRPRPRSENDSEAAKEDRESEPARNKSNSKFSRLMLKERSEGKLRVNFGGQDDDSKGSSSLLVKFMTRDRSKSPHPKSPDNRRRSLIPDALFKSKSAKKLQSNNSNVKLADKGEKDRKSSADLQNRNGRSPRRNDDEDSVPHSAPVASSKKADWGSTKEDKEDGEEDDVIDEKEEIRLRNKYAKGRGARRTSVDIATALKIPTLNMGKIKSKNFNSVPEDDGEEVEGGSSNEDNNPGSSPAPVLKSSKSKGKSVGIPNPKKLLDVGKRMGRRATLMLDQGILLKSDKLAAAAANWEKTQGQTGVADGPKIPESAIYEPAAVAPTRQRSRALTIANTASAKTQMDMLKTKEKIPTVFKYTAGVGGDDGEDKNKKSVKKKLKGGGEDNLKVFVAGTMTNWESRQMARTDDGFIVVLECQEGDVYYKFFVSDGDSGAGSGGKDKETGKPWKGNWVVDRNQEVASNKDFWNPVEANIIRISRDDNDVFAALTVDSFCVKNNADKEDEDREANEDLWTQEKPDFEGKDSHLKDIVKNPPILPPQLLNVLLNKEQMDPRRRHIEDGRRDDRMHLPHPNSHVVVNHLYAQSIRNDLLVMASTTRYKKKSVTVVFYKNLEGV